MKESQNYDIAHIYPLNPTKEEESLLRNEDRLSEDPNHIDNWIPLSKEEHVKFDKPRTVEDYRKLLAIKKMAIQRSISAQMALDYSLEKDIQKIIFDLHKNLPERESEPTYRALQIAQKFDSTITNLTKRKIADHITDYYRHIQMHFSDLEKQDPGCSERIFSQVRIFYSKLKSLKYAQEDIFSEVADWIHKRSSATNLIASEIMTSFFIQNCEVFDDNAQ